MKASDETAEATMAPESSSAWANPSRLMLTVAAVARRLGVAPSTLRTWDRRYGLGPSAHTAGAHRRYSPTDVARLMVMRRLTLEGLPPADAARIVLAGPEVDEMASITSLDDRRTGGPSSVSRPDSVTAETAVDLAVTDFEEFVQPDLVAAQEWSTDSAVWLDKDYPGSPAGGGRIVAMPTGSPQARGLARAAMSLDTQTTGRLMWETLRRDGVMAAWEDTVVPVLQALGERTAATGDGIDVEHAFSEVLLGVLRGFAFNVRSPRNAAPILLVCAEDDRHTLPLHVLAAALAEQDISTRMLGAGLPMRALGSAVRRCGPCAVVIHAQLPATDAAIAEQIRRQRPAPRVILSGPGWSPETIPTSAHVVNTMTAALNEVVLSLHL